ncbi:MAG: DUF5666 domain-containing protein, partial [Candidatus Methylomirabilis sp.]|nr:DUF5666 domain-containing protein [Deltaproteobacteria bacterium]
TVTLDDNPGGADDLRVGQYVTLRGLLFEDGVTGRGDDVVFDDEVQGPIESLNLPGGSLVVLGRTVLTDARTVIRESGTDAPLTLAQLAVGNIVEASGLVNAQGEVAASRIERKSTVFEPGESELEVKGTISNLDAVARTFTLTVNATVFGVDYSAASVRGVLANDVFVEVKTESAVVGGVIDATRVKVEDDGGAGEPGEEAELKGFVTRFASVTDFDVKGRPVTTTAFTEFRGGTSAQLGLGDLVEVEGPVNSLGVLVARKVQFEDEVGDDGEEDERKVTGAVTRFTSSASFAVAGQEVITTAKTEFEDGSASDLALGVVVEVEGVLNGSDVLVAKKVKFEDKRAAPAVGASAEEDATPGVLDDDGDRAGDDRVEHEPGDDHGMPGDDDPADHDLGDDR